MGQSNTFKYQLGRYYTIKDIDYFAFFSSNTQSDTIEKAKGFIDAKIKKDYFMWTLLIPLNPTMNNPNFADLIKRYSLNAEKIKVKK
jgi:hypothetical protein